MFRIVMVRGAGRAGAILAAAALTLAGCAATGTPVPAEIDVRKLDVGSFGVERQELTGTAGSESGKLLESMRMSQAVPAAVEVDSALITGRGYRALTSVAEVLDANAVAGKSRQVLSERQYVTGFMMSGSDKPNRPNETKSPPDAATAQIAMLRFPDDDTAKKAAQELEDTDFGISPENQKVTIDKYGDALVHWRPTVPTMGVFFAKGPLVLSGYVQRPAPPNREELAGVIEKLLDAAVPRMEAFKPTPVSDLSKLPQDANGMLSRVVRTDTGAVTPHIHQVAVLSATGLLYGARDAGKRRTVVTTGGIDAFANIKGSWVLRARDEASAKRAQEPLMGTFSDWDEAADPPRDVPGAQCRRLNSRLVPKDDAYRCFITYDRYLATVYAGTKQAAQQKAAAQYALLANSG